MSKPTKADIDALARLGRFNAGDGHRVEVRWPVDQEVVYRVTLLDIPQQYRVQGQTFASATRRAFKEWAKGEAR